MNFNSAILVDVIRMESYVDSFLDPTCVQVKVSINKFNLVPNWIVALSCPETAEVWVRASRVVLFDPLLKISLFHR